MNPVFSDSPFECRYLTLDLITGDTTTLVTPESLEGAPSLSRGLYAISTATPCAMRIFRFSAFFFQPLPVQVLYFIYRRVLLLLSYIKGQ